MKQTIILLGIVSLLSYCTPTKCPQKVDAPTHNIFGDIGPGAYFSDNIRALEISEDTLTIQDTSIHHIRIGRQLFDIIHYPTGTVDIMPRMPDIVSINDSTCRVKLR
jgi:hypothetical protein